MGLSVVISGGIILSIMMMLFFTMPGLVDKMFSIGDTASQVAQFEKSISDTKISMEDLDVSVNSPKINFTVINDGGEKLWNFNDFNLFVTYDEATGRPTETLSYGGQCQGVVPSAGSWCIETISEDILDPDVLNGGESARIWTQVDNDLTTGNTIVSFNTDNGATATLPVTSRSIVATGVDPPVACQSGFYGRNFVDMDSGIIFYCDPIRNKWLSETSMSIWGDEGGTCNIAQDADSDPDCNVDWGNGLGPSQTSGLAIPHNATIIGHGFSQNGGVDCTSGSFDLEVWGSNDLTTDDTTTYIGDLASGLVNVDVSSNLLNNLDVDAQFIKWGIDNNCGENMNQWIMGIFYKWHHDDP
jgi:hypothetical protein